MSVISRLEDMIKSLGNLGPAFVRIGTLLQAQIKLNIRQQGLIDTGNLLNSVRFELIKDGTKTGVRVGSFGVKYAAVHEYGFKGTMMVRAHTRTITQAFGKPIKARAVSVRQHSMRANFRKRPYIKPAIQKHKTQIIEIIRLAIRGGK